MDGRDDLCFLSAGEIARLIRRKTVSPVEVVDTFLDRVDRINPQLNAFCTVACDQARRRAREAEDRVVRAERCGPLHGVGLPLSMSGAEHELTRLSKLFGRRLEARYRLPVEFVDERLSSFAAQEALREAGISGKAQKAHIDQVAAQCLLQAYLEEKKNGITPDP